MSALTLSKIRFRAGVWDGRIDDASASGATPDIAVRLLDRRVETVTLSPGDTPGAWHLAITIPPETLGDGVHCFVISDERTDTKLGDFTLIAGEPLSDELRAEVALLRAELDMLKRAFRRHCLETE